MSYKFEMILEDDLEGRVAEAKRLIEENGGNMSGDSKTGTFSISGVEGSYHSTGTQVTITIKKKPMLVTHGFIEKKVRQYFA
jgi:hypothetical protein